MKTSHILISAVLAASCCLAAAAGTHRHVENYPVSAVRLTESPFRHAMQMDMRYLLGLDPDRLLAPYLKQAGLTPKAPNYTNWENTGLDGHIGGHYLSALSYMYAATGDAEIKRRLDYMLSELRRCQDAAGDGYLCGAPDGRRIWTEVSRGDIRPGGFNLNGGWVPLYNIHKTYAGLRDAWLQAGSTEARDMLVALTDWMAGLTAGLTDDQVQQMLVSEHGGLNEVFADVAAITGKPEYLELARRFSHRTLLDPLLAGQDRLTGMHANTQIPKIIGFKRIADLTGDEAMDRAARFFWDTVVTDRTVSIGGNSVYEHFHPADDFSSMMSSEQGPETCNTYNMLRLSRMLYETSADTRYMDFYERALHNHILSTINPVQGGFVYFTPMRPGHYRVYSQPQTSMWCCVGSGLENHARYGEAIYAHSSDTVFANLYIPSRLTCDRGLISQTTAFPASDSITFAIDPATEGAEFALAMRIPSWTRPDQPRVSVNGKAQPATVSDGYLTLRRRWHKGDTVRLVLPMHLDAEPLPDGSEYVSFVYGPTVLAARTGTERQDGMYADDSRGGHIAHGPRTPLNELPAIISDLADITTRVTPTDGKPLRFSLTGLSDGTTVTLEPFAGIHESRYMLYFPRYTASQWQQKRDQIAEAERRRAALEAITADKVTCGEQQPESDHFITIGSSVAGDDDGIHWRETTDTFAYRMNPAGRPVAKVRVTYRPDPKRDAIIMADGIEIGTLPASDGPVTQLDLPLASTAPLTITISRHQTPTTPRIHSIRLLTQ